MIALLLEPALADVVFSLLIRLSMIGTINFDYQSLFATYKVDYVISNNMLPQEFEA